MRQQFFNLTILVRRQTSRHVLDVGLRIMPVELGALKQTHHRSGALTRSQRTGKQPIVASDGNWANLVLDPVVVNGQLSVIQKLRQCRPALEAVIERFGRSRAICDLLPLQHHPLAVSYTHLTLPTIYSV